MNRLCKSLVCLAAMGTVVVSYGATPVRTHSVTDAALFNVKAYELSPEEAATFSTIDGVASPFWFAWEKDGVTLSTADINGIANWAWGTLAEGETDGTMRLKVAYGDSGIYILYAAQDDAWAGYISPIDYANDACELFAAKISTAALYGDQIAVNLPCLNGDALAASTFPHQMNADYSQVQIRFGGLEPVETFSFNYWNPLMDFATYGCSPANVVYNRAVTFVQAESQYGIKIDILPVEGQWRSQEWFVPWRSWGSPNTTALTRRIKGEKIGMCFGYNDLDPTQTEPTASRWRSADPYANTVEERAADATIPLTSYDAWGDIEFSDLLSVVSPPPWGTAIKAPIAQIKKLSGTARSEFFTIDGKSITSTRSLPASAVVLRRVTLDNGKTITARVPMSAVR